jgi:hypothetical protein
VPLGNFSSTPVIHLQSQISEPENLTIVSVKTYIFLQTECSRNATYHERGKKMRTCSIVFVSVMFLVSALFADVIKKDEIKKVKKIAVISFYSTKKVMCFEPKSGASSMGLKDYVVKDPSKSDAPAGWKGANQSEPELNELCKTALKIYEDSLSKTGYWDVIPFESIKDNAVYQSTPVEITKVEENIAMSMMMSSMHNNRGGSSSQPAKAEKKTEAEYKTLYRVPEGMRCLPADMFREAGTTYSGNDPYKSEKKALAEICKGLGVDGVAIIHFNPLYKYGSWARLKVGEYVKGSPRIGAGLVVLSSDGKVVAETGDIVSKLGWDFEGSTVNLIKNDQLMLADKEVKDGYAATIGESAGRMKEILSKELSKIK